MTSSQINESVEPASSAPTATLDPTESAGPVGVDAREVAGANPLMVRWRLFSRSFRQNWSLFAASKVGIVGLVMIAVFAIMAVAHPILMSVAWNDSIYDPVSGYDAPIVSREVVEQVSDPTSQVNINDARLDNPYVNVGDVLDVPQQPAPPGRSHLLGTDQLGRDVLSQLLFGARAAFAMAAIAGIVTVVFGTILGSVAAYYGGTVDNAIMRVADLFLLIPLIPVLIFVGGLWELTLPALGVLIGVLSGFGPVAIVLKSQALSVKVKPFIDAAKVAGGSDFRIITRHIIPNVLPLSFLYMMFTVTGAIAAEATLSFFGLLNVDMSWGIMIQTAQAGGYMLQGANYWWLLFPAGMAVTLLSMGFYLVGRGLDEVVNPRLRSR
jgi:peptide/nickel transport system permease protein